VALEVRRKFLFVQIFMQPEARCTSEAPAAGAAFVRALPGVGANVPLEIAGLDEALAAGAAFVRALPGVGANVRRESV
jgi:hypothetical protein